MDEITTNEFHGGAVSSTAKATAPPPVPLTPALIAASEQGTPALLLAPSAQTTPALNTPAVLRSYDSNPLTAVSGIRFCLRAWGATYGAVAVVTSLQIGSRVLWATPGRNCKGPKVLEKSSDTRRGRDIQVFLRREVGPNSF